MCFFLTVTELHLSLSVSVLNTSKFCMAYSYSSLLQLYWKLCTYINHILKFISKGQHLLVEELSPLELRIFFVFKLPVSACVLGWGEYLPFTTQSQL